MISRRSLISVLAIIGASKMVGTHAAHAAPAEVRFNFSRPLEGWETVTGSWAIEEVPGAPNGRALVQRATNNPFNVIVAPVADVVSRKQIATWPTREARSNFPRAFDRASNRVLVAFRGPSTFMAFDAQSGTPAAKLAVCGDADDIFVDARRNRVYVSCGEGSIDVLTQRGSGYERIGHIQTSSGARTSFFMPELDRLFVAVRATSREPAAVWVFRPAS
jgi:hypothetical protein